MAAQVRSSFLPSLNRTDLSCLVFLCLVWPGLVCSDRAVSSQVVIVRNLVISDPPPAHPLPLGSIISLTCQDPHTKVFEFSMHTRAVASSSSISNKVGGWWEVCAPPHLPVKAMQTIDCVPGATPRVEFPLPFVADMNLTVKATDGQGNEV